MSDIEVNTSKSNIPKLDDTNYTLWSSRMRAYLGSKDLLQICTGETVMPTEKKRHETSNILISHLGDLVFDSVITIENKDQPAAIWKAITDCYASSSINNKARV
jgi:hypothetical protein